MIKKRMIRGALLVRIETPASEFVEILISE